MGEKAMISNGIRATEITVKGGLIEGRGDAEGEESFGIYMEPSQMDDGTPIPVKFELVGGDVVAYGETQGLLADTEDFAGVSYKADENAEAQVKTDLSGKEFFFGNKYKVSYAGGDVMLKISPPTALITVVNGSPCRKKAQPPRDISFGVGWMPTARSLKLKMIMMFP